MADWSILGWPPHLADDTVHLGLRGDRRGACCRTPDSDTGIYGIRLQEAGSRFFSSVVIDRPDRDRVASLGTSNLAQSQARDFHVTFGPPSRLSPRRVTPRRGIHLNLHPTPASATSLAGRVFYQRRRRAPLDIPLGCLQVARRSLFLGRGTFPLASARGCGGIPSRPPGLVLHTRSFLLPCQPRYAVRVATFLERRIPPAKRHPTSPHRLLAQNFPYLGTYFARSKCDPPACFAWQVLFFSFKPDV